MSRLYFVRHGESWSNIEKLFSHKHVDLSLTPKGLLQAQQAAEFFVGKPIAAIYASPMKRAAETAAAIGARIGLPVTLMEEFREVNVGALEGKPFNAENWGLYHRITGQWLAGQPEVSFPAGEDYFSLWERTRRGLTHILARSAAQDVILVGHAGIFSVTLKEICPEIDVEWIQSAEIYNCSVTELELNLRDGQISGRIVQWAVHEHLHGNAADLVPGIPPIESL